jgi:hypothetical protein
MSAATVSAVKAAEKKKKRKASPPPVVETLVIPAPHSRRSSRKRKKKMRPSMSRQSWRIGRRGGWIAPLPRGSGSWCRRRRRMPYVKF